MSKRKRKDNRKGEEPEAVFNDFCCVFADRDVHSVSLAVIKQSL